MSKLTAPPRFKRETRNGAADTAVIFWREALLHRFQFLFLKVRRS
jgi:hypothetical protein